MDLTERARRSGCVAFRHDPHHRFFPARGAGGGARARLSQISGSARGARSRRARSPHQSETKMSVSGGGRLPTALDAAMVVLNASVHVDSALWREDIAGSKAHARGLARIGVISDEEASQIVTGLTQIAGEIERGEFRWQIEKEDVHMNIESRLTELVPAGAKLHTGRSRNDQIATDLRLWARSKCLELEHAISELGETIVLRAEQQIDLLMPAYTHLERAQPSRVSHHLMAWQELLWRDLGRVRDAAQRLNECPLGAGA